MNRTPSRTQRIPLKKIRLILPVVLLILIASVRLHAQGIDGCTDSPENPTLILGLIVGAAGLGYTRLRHRLRSRNKSDN